MFPSLVSTFSHHTVVMVSLT